MADRQVPNGVIGQVTLPNGQKLDVIIAQPLRAFLQDLDGSARANNTRVGSILSGYARKSALASETAARIAGDSALAGQNDGTGTSNSGTYDNITVTDATWVQAKTLLVTPTGPPGTYSFTITADMVFDGYVYVSDEGVFQGLWRLVEERVSDGDTTVLDSGTFSVTYTPGVSEGEISVPNGADATFTGLPTAPVAANYDSTQTRIRFEFSRASGSNTVSGMAGSIAVTWNA